MDEESVLSSDTLLEKHPSIEVHYKDFDDERRLPLSRKQRWKEYIPRRRTLLAHALVLAFYWSVAMFVFDRIVKHYEHGPDHTYCRFSR